MTRLLDDVSGLAAEPIGEAEDESKRTANRGFVKNHPWLKRNGFLDLRFTLPSRKSLLNTFL
jgi:hypothetical protein